MKLTSTLPFALALLGSAPALAQETNLLPIPAPIVTTDLAPADIAPSAFGGDLADVFTQLDRDGSGGFSLDEMLASLRDAGDVSETEMALVFDDMDISDDGLIDHMEFETYHVNRTPALEMDGFNLPWMTRATE